MERYEVLGMVGEGSFGKVYKSKIRQTNEVVAFKVIRKHGRSEKDLRSLRRECEIQQHLNHPNIIHMLDSFETENEIVVVTEFADEALNDLLGKVGYLPEERVRQICCDLVSALYYLHSHRVLHRDLKPQNILMGTNGIAKLCDFGFARSMSTGTLVLTSLKGTPLYMAPELIEERPYDHNADLWSLGCIVYELLVGSPPFTTSSIIHLVRLIQHEAVKWPDFISPTCKSFIQGLLQKDPNQRLPWPELLEHPFVKDNILIFKNENAITSFTTPLTESQNIAKEIQKQDLVNRNAGMGQTRVLARVVQKIEDYEKKIRLQNVTAASIETDLKKKCGLSGSKSSNSCSNSMATNMGIQGSPNTPLSSDHKNLSDEQSQECAPAEETLDDPATRSLPKQPDSLLQEKLSVDLKVPNNSVNTEPFKNNLGRLDSIDSISKEVGKLSVPGINLSEKSSVPNENENMQKISFQPDINDQQKEDRSTFTLSNWDSSEANHPIENDEWLDFLQRTMEEVMDGEVEPMHQINFLSIALSPLRNPGASSRVIEYVACLLSLPFIVDGVIDVETSKIRKAYLEVKAIPNLVYASKLVVRSKCDNDSLSPVSTEDSGSVSELSADKLQAFEAIYLLICNLVYASKDFLVQFCDAVLVIKATPLLQQLLLLGRRKVRVVSDLLAILCQILRDLPENAALVEEIVLDKDNMMDFHRMLTHYTPMIRERTCKLLRLLGRCSGAALRRVWNKVLREHIEALLYDSNEMVRTTAEEALREIRSFTFYSQNSCPEPFK